MRFWNVIVYNTETRKEEGFGVSSDDKHDAAYVKRILVLIHPEYQKIRFRRCKKPRNWDVDK